MANDYAFRYKLADGTILACDESATVSVRNKPTKVLQFKSGEDVEQRVLEDIYQERMKHRNTYARTFYNLPSGVFHFAPIAAACSRLTYLHLDLANMRGNMNLYDWLDFDACPDIRAPLHTIDIKGKLKHLNHFLKHLHCETTLCQLALSTTLGGIDYYELAKAMHRHTRLRVLNVYDVSLTHSDVLNLMGSTYAEDFHVKFIKLRPLKRHNPSLKNPTIDMIARTRVQCLNVDNLMRWRPYWEAYFQRLRQSDAKVLISMDNDTLRYRRDTELKRRGASGKRRRLNEVTRLLKTL